MQFPAFGWVQRAMDATTLDETTPVQNNIWQQEGGGVTLQDMA